MKRSLTCLFSVLFLFHQAKDKADSLILKLRDAKQDTSKVILLNKIGRELLYVDPAKSLAYSDSAELLAKQLGYQRGLAKCYTNKGIYYRNASQFDVAFQYHTDAISISEQINDKKTIASNYTNLGILFKNQANYKKSIEYHLKAKKMYEELKDRSGIATALQNLSNSYRRAGQPDLAIESGMESLKLYDELNDDPGRRSSYNSIGVVYLEDKKDYNKALVYLLRMEIIVDKLNDLNGKSICYLNLGSCYSSLGKYKLAEEYARKSLEISKKLNAIEMQGDAFRILSEMVEKRGDSRQALAYFKQYQHLLDSNNALRYKQSTLELEEKFHAEKSKKEIDLLSSVNELKTKENEAQKKQLSRNRITIALFILFGALITVLAFLAYKNLQQSKKLNGLLTLRNDQVEHQRKEILDSILYARRIQDSILPPKEELDKTFPKHFIIYKPRDIVSGDFYWTHSLTIQDTHRDVSVLALCDCTGHGVPGAFMSLISYNILNHTVKDSAVTGPDTVLNLLARDLPVALRSSGRSHDLRDGLDIALAGIDFANLTLECAMAHIPIYICNGKELKFIKPDKQSISADNYDPGFKFTLHKIKLNKGERIYFCTDGFADQFGGEKGKKLKYKQLEKLLLETHSAPLEEQKNRLENYFDLWKGKLEQVDDVTLIGIEV